MGRFSEPVTAVLARLNAQKASGKLLEGWTVSPIPVTTADGADHYPMVRFQRVEIDDQSEEQGASFATVTLSLEVAVKKSSDLTSILEGVEKVMDSVEIDATTNEIDLTVANTTIRGIVTKSAPASATGVCLSMYVDVKLETVPYTRGARHSS